MSDDIKFGIKVVYDGGQARAEIAGTRSEIDKLADSIKKAGDAAAPAGKQLGDMAREGAARVAEMNGVSGGLARTLVSVLPPALAMTAAGIAAMGAAYAEGRREVERMNHALDLTGNFAGSSAASLHAMAGHLAGTTATIGETKKLLVEMASSGQVGAAAFNHVADAAVAYARATGQSLEAVTPAMVKLFTDPAKGAEELNRTMHFLSVAQTEHIASMQRQGDVTGAQIELSKALEARLAEIPSKLGYVETAWKSVQGVASKAWDAMMGVGRAPDTRALLQASRAQEQWLASTEARNLPDIAGRRLKAHQETLRLEEKLNQEALKSWQEGEAARLNQLEHNAQALASTYSKSAQIRVLEDKKVLAQSIVDEQQRFETIKAIDEKIDQIRNGRARAPGKPKVDNGVDDFAREQAKDYAKLYEEGLKYAQGVDLQLAAGRKLTEGEKILALAKANLTKEQYAEIEAILAGAVAREASVAALREATKAADEAAKAENDYMKPLEDRLDKTREEIEYYGMSASAIESVIVKRLEDKLAQETANGASTETIAQLQREIAVRRDLAGALGSKEALDANKKAAEESAKAWEKITDDINKQLVDAIFDGGVDAGELLKRYFRTLVLAPLVQTATAPLTNALGQFLGYNVSGSNAGGGFGGAGNLLSTGNSLYNAYNGGGMLGSAYTGLAYSSFGQSLGLSSALTAEGSAAIGMGADAIGATSMTSLGAGLAAAAPYLAAAVAVLSMIDWGGGTPHTGGTAYSSGNGYETPRGRAAINAYYADPTAENQMGLTDWTRRWSQPTADALGPAAQGFAKSFNDIVKTYGGAGGYTVGLGFSADGEDPVRARSTILDAQGHQIAFAKDNNALGSDPQTGLQRMLAEQVPQLMLTALRDVDLGGEINQWLDSSLTASGDLIKTLTKNQVDGMLSMLSGGAMDDFIRRMHLVGASFDTVTAALTRSGPGFFQLEQMINQLGEGIRASLAGSRQAIELGGLTKAETYDYYDKRAQKANDLLGIAATAEDVAKYVGQLNEAIMAGWNSLDGDQQRAQRDEFLARMDAVEERAASRNEAIRDTWAQAQNLAAGRLTDTFTTGAAQIAAAAAIPQQVNVTVTLAGAAAGAEVGGW